MKDYYEILGVPFDADFNQIKTAYRDAMKKYHPDNAGIEASLEKAQEASEAYEILSNVDKKRQYDNIIGNVPNVEKVQKEILNPFDEFAERERNIRRYREKLKREREEYYANYKCNIDNSINEECAEIIDKAVLATLAIHGKRWVISSIEKVLNNNSFEMFPENFENNNIREQLENKVGVEEFRKYVRNSLDGIVGSIIEDFIDKIIYNHKGKILDEAFKVTALKYGDDNEILNNRVASFVYGGQANAISSYGENNDKINYRERVLNNIKKKEVLDVIKSIIKENGVDYANIEVEDIIPTYANITIKNIKNNKKY